MNPPYVHTLVNHFPIVLTGGRDCRPPRGTPPPKTRRLVLCARHPHVFRRKRTIVFAHAATTNYAPASILLLGLVSGYAWWRLLRADADLPPPAWLRILVAILAALGLTVVARTAYLGGKIVHGSPRLEKAPPGVEVEPTDR
jgi:hypothetical protein